MPELHLEHPGLLFVAATLLPLASFVLLLCAGGLRWLLKPHAAEGSAARAVYVGLGGDVGGSWPAFVALGAIALACVCSITGFVLFLTDHHETEHELAPIQAKIAALKQVEKDAD